MSNVSFLRATVNAWTDEFYEDLNQYAGDLRPGHYTREQCAEYADLTMEICMLARQVRSVPLCHSYNEAEIHKAVALCGGFVGDSLGLAQFIERELPENVHYSSVYFMPQTAKCIVGDKSRIFVQGEPSVHSCSLVLGEDHAHIDRWIAKNPTGVLCTYINSSLKLKAKSHYIGTSSNMAEVIARAWIENPGSKILLLPDKFLGVVKKAEAHNEYGVPLELMEIYTKPFGGFNACCYVHEKIGDAAPEEALDKYPDSELLLHPECGCASACLYKLNQGVLPRDRVFYRSTEGMLHRVRESNAKVFVVGTEMGMIYRLRHLCPDRTFVPISSEAKCAFMKANTLVKMRDSMRDGRYEIVFDDDIDVGIEAIRGNVIPINRAAAAKARGGIQRMLTTASRAELKARLGRK